MNDLSVYLGKYNRHSRCFVSMVYYCLFIIVQLSRSINNRHRYKVRQLHDVKLLPPLNDCRQQVFP
jgi:hypothetical protein